MFVIDDKLILDFGRVNERGMERCESGVFSIVFIREIEKVVCIDIYKLFVVVVLILILRICFLKSFVYFRLCIVILMKIRKCEF